MKERLGYDTGGTIYSKIYGIYYRAASDDVRVITVTGGHFAQNLEQMNWLGEDYECLDNGDGTWKVAAKE